MGEAPERKTASPEPVQDTGDVHAGEEQAAPRRRSAWKKRAVMTVVAIVVVWIVFAYVIPRFANYNNVFQVLGELKVTQLILLVAVALANLVSAWSMYQVSLPGLGFWQAAQLMLSQNLISNTMPLGAPLSLGLGYQVINSYGFGAKDFSIMLGVSGIWNSFAKLALPVVAVVLMVFAGHTTGAFVTMALIGVGILAAAVTLLVLIFWKRALAKRLGDLAGRAASRVLRPFHKGPVTTWGDALVGFRDRSVSIARRRWIALSLVAIAYQLTTYWVFLLSIRFSGITASQVSGIDAFGVFAFARLVSMIPITPGALGIAEASYTGFLVAAGAPQPQAVAAVLLFRGLTYLMPLPLGLPAYLAWLVKHKWKRQETAETEGASREGKL
jgi:uncharacterized membrane protein YbhN (UPF0104 family)